jgi:hypothetical protein
MQRCWIFPPSRGDERRLPITIHRGGEGQRVGCRACDVAFRDRTPGDLALVPCPVCGPVGEVISLPMPDTWPSDYADEERALK